MIESMPSVFDELVAAGPPDAGTSLFDTACVLGGSVAGLLAARVLSDHARRVVVVERDNLDGPVGSRAGVPQVQQVHALLPSGLHWIERWLPGFTQDARDKGAVLGTPAQVLITHDGSYQPSGSVAHSLLTASRPFLEARLRDAVTALPNVSVLRARVTGLDYRDDAVGAVRYVGDEPGVLAADFVVDAMGRGSRLAEWLEQDGFDKPAIERLQSPINYATALFERPEQAVDLEVSTALGTFTPQYRTDGVSIATLSAVEDEQWIVMLVGFGEDRPGATTEEFRTVCASMPEVWREATKGAVTRDVVTYRQADSRRRDFVGANRLPARLVAVGDAVASFNPIYGQGMSSAVLHASCLSRYLVGGHRFDSPATAFFDLQQVVVDAAWAVSAGGDMARLDALNGTDVPEDVRRRRWALEQIMTAAMSDSTVARAFNDVSFMLRHPGTLADPALLERAVAVTKEQL
ncbi:FAD-dependent oxidoreductase [Streptomyces sp. NPDC059255]|uniref:FAD-dependent oxidoreductase n=1 Tax=Streptomyces sp. NPDC059255 TaxID=3346793 RepID=UPI00369B96E5